MQSMWKICAEQALRALPALAASGAMALGLLSAAPAAFAAPSAIEAFDKARWLALRSARQPAIVVFSSVTCTHCPGAIANIAQQKAAQGSRTPLLVVSMDAEDEAVLLRDPHYAPADRLLAFRGQSLALQYAVNPDWRGMTPYVALVDGKGGVRFVLGEPKPQVFAKWLESLR